MDFSTTDEQNMLLDSCDRWARQRGGFSNRRELLTHPPAERSRLWSELAEMGLTALLVPASNGGLERPLIDAALVAQSLGRGWLIEPFAECAIGAAHMLAQAPASGVAAQTLAAIASGEQIVVPLASGPTAASPGANVTQAAAADALLSYDGESLLLVRRGDAALSAYRQFDGTPGATVRWDPALATALARGDPARHAWQRGLAAMAIGRIGSGLGLARTVLDLTADYLRTRQQFGQPIGRFQALAHRLADLLVDYEMAQSIWLAAALRPASPRTLAAAQVLAHQALRAIGQQAMQLHGAIGMTEELAISHYVKHLLALEITLGPRDDALHDFMAASA